MESDLTRLIKKPRLVYNKSSSCHTHFDDSLKFSSQIRSFGNCNDYFAFTGVNNCLPTVRASQTNSLICSHETIKIELDVGSGSINPSPFIEMKEGDMAHNNDTQDNKIVFNNHCIPDNVPLQRNSMADQLLSMDDSLLENIDLGQPYTWLMLDEKDNNITNDAKRQKFLSETPIKGPDNKHYKHSPDMFISTDHEKDETSDSEDQAWDMSISCQEDQNKPLTCESKGNSCENNVLSPGFSNIVLSSWESPPSVKKNRTFEGLLKRTLTSNAHKSIIHHSPLGSEFSSLGDKRSCIDEELYFGLPIIVKRLIKRFKGINKLYDWQEECLNLPAVENRKNLVYALPTSGGKTLVAEILVFKEILCREKNVLFVLPYVSIAQEKVRAFSPFAVELGFLVEEYAGSKGSYPPPKRRRKHCVYVATIEKALGLVHSLIECQRIQELGLVVVDELHLIGEPKRGANLESMLVKIIHMEYDIQIIGMSATIGNLPDIAKFLQADVYTQHFRPVELTEYIKVEDELFKVDHSVSDDVPLVFHSKFSHEYTKEQLKQDPDKIGALVKEVIPEHSCLIFCPSKKNCENVALLICSALDKVITEHKSEDKKALFRSLTTEGNGNVCPTLRKTLPFGVAYHHSGLTTAERCLLEEAFLAKTICCICCTSTLAAGVNLPARRVILRSPYIGTQLLTLSKYKQMVGRAGRTGMGDVGESFLLCKPQDAQKVGELLSSSMDLCTSQLQGTGLECLLISALDLSLSSSMDSLLALCQSSLLAVQAEKLGVDVVGEVLATLDKLVTSGALTRSESSLALSRIGKAAVKANVDTETAKQLYADLVTAQDSLVLLSHLHLLYLVTPYTMLGQISFQKQAFCSAYMELAPKDIQAARIVGIGEHCVAQLMAGRSLKGSLNDTLHRFYLSLILFDLWNQNSVWRVANKYNIPRGLVHNLLVSASAFSSSVVRFCEVLEDMWCFKLLLSEMSSRLTHCCTQELLPLMELPAVKIGRAKQLYNAGFKTLSILAKTEPKALALAVDHMPRRVAHQIVAAAKLMLLAKAESLQEEAEAVLEGL